MELSIPEYKNEKRVMNDWTLHTDEFMIELNNDNIKKMLQKLDYKELQELQKDATRLMEKNLKMKYFKMQYDNYKKWINSTIDCDHMPEFVFDKYDKLNEPINAYMVSLVDKNNLFVKNNYDFFNAKIEEQIEEIRSHLRKEKAEKNRQYYLKVKANRPPMERPLLTEEQKKENKREANKAYYEKQKEQRPATERPTLTEEEKKERRKLANKAYYEKQKLKKDGLI
jgi:hypothetical protein